MNDNPIPQLSPATVLAQLLAEHPELPSLFWTIHPNGWWSGSLHTDDVDARAVMAAFVTVVGGTPHEMWRTSEDHESGTRRFATILAVTWRDVHLYLTMGCDAAMVAGAEQVAA